MPALGWIKPEKKHIARLKLAGTPASGVLSDFPMILPSVDLREKEGYMITLDQLSLGSCVANGVNQAARSAQIKMGAPISIPIPSRLWTYTLSLAADGNLGRDVGTHVCTAIEQLARRGFPPETSWPYDLASFGNKPPMGAYHDAADQETQQDLAYHGIDATGSARLEQIKAVLSQGYLIPFGTLVTSEFCSTSPKDVVMRPRSDAKIAGGHCMCWCGYKVALNGRLWLLTLNSWGPGFGENGFFWMDQDYVTWSETDDLWYMDNVPQYSHLFSKAA